jgi:hypothetical protein
MRAEEEESDGACRRKRQPGKEKRAHDGLRSSQTAPCSIFGGIGTKDQKCGANWVPVGDENT